MSWKASLIPCEKRGEHEWAYRIGFGANGESDQQGHVQQLGMQRGPGEERLRVATF